MDNQNIQELEYKFKADSISLTQFTEVMNTLGFIKKLETSSWDIYFVKPNEPEMFQRLRLSEIAPELTKKRKTTANNNWDRIEIDLPLDPARIKESIVTKFVALDGYEKNFKIYKSCFIYWKEQVNFVYYVVYDEEMVERGRFIEVEINKEIAHKLEDPFAVLNENVKHFEAIGLNPKTRLKRSLYEIFRRETK